MEYNINLLNEDFIKRIVSLSRERRLQVYVVGGFLRDVIVGRRKEALDIDFTVNKDAIGLARAFANNTKSGFVVLDRDHGCARVLYKSYTLDFTDFRGKDLKDDLLHRDFTINTLALKLPFKGDFKKSLIDYYGALKDLHKRIIRITSKDSFKEDYLRILRAFSLAAIFNFKIEKNTLSFAKRGKKHLLKVSGERIRDELFKILSVDNSIFYIKNLDTSGILSCIIPQIELMRSLKQGPYHHLDVWGHSLEALNQYELLMSEIADNVEIGKYLKEKIAGDRKRFQILKLVCLLHDIGKPQTYQCRGGKTSFHGHERIGKQIAKDISERLKLSTKERFAIDTIIYWHLRPGYLADIKNFSERAKFRYFRDTEDEAVSILLLSIADQRATRGPFSKKKSRKTHEEIAFSLLQEYFSKKKEKKFIRLISGDDLIKRLKLKPSALFKIILEEVEEAQAEGSIVSKKDALLLAKKIAIQSRSKNKHSKGNNR